MKCIICGGAKTAIDGECLCLGSKKILASFKLGDRVLVKENSGFSRGAKGVVVERPDNAGPYEKQIWVLRDGAESSCFFLANELELDLQPPTAKAFSAQEGGNHYKNLPIPPAEFVHKNRIPYLEGSVIYYVIRWREKNGLADLKKARHTLDLIIEMEESNGRK